MVSKLRAIPALVALMANGDATRIAAYIDQYPGKVDILEAIRAMDDGSLLVVFQETAPGTLSKRETWRHRLSLFLKPVGKMSDAWVQIVNGVPTNGDGLKMLYTESLNSALHRMNPPGIRRQFLTIDAANGVVIDYFEISITFDEKGD